MHDTQSLSTFDPTSHLTSQPTVCTAAHPSQTLLLPVCAFAPAVLCVWTTLFPDPYAKLQFFFPKQFVYLCFCEAFCDISFLELMLSILYAYLHDYICLLNIAQLSGAPRQLCACEGEP